MIMGKMIGGGVEAVVMNYYRYIDKDKFQFDFIIDKDSTVVPQKEIEQLGGNIYLISPYQYLFQYTKDLETLFKKNKYLIVHSHINALSVFPLRIAKKCNIPIRIAHNHSTAAPGEKKKNLIKKILKLFDTKYPTHYMSPTKRAGEWLFGKKIANNELFILKNAIEINKFAYRPDVRQSLRQQLGYSDGDFIIGNIGRLVWQKNQEFLIHVFSKVEKDMSNARLIILGDGPKQKELINLVEDLKIETKVKFLSNVKDVQNYYQVMDYFVFPSRYEGLGMVAIEAQVSGLPVLGSINIPMDVRITSNYQYLHINKNYEEWAKQIEQKKIVRMTQFKGAIENGYEIKKAVLILEKKYEEIIKEKNL